MKLLASVFLLFPILLFSQSFEKGEKLFSDGKYDQAQPIFESYLKNNPSNLKTIEYLGDYYYKYGGALGMKSLEVNKFKALGMMSEIRSSFEKTIALNPKHIEARWALIELNLQLPGIVGGSETKAIKYSAELRELSPVDGYLSRGHIDEYFNRYTAAEQQYKRAILIGRSKVCYQKLADLYKNKMNQPDKANTVWEEYKNKKQ
jgi:tetratricopeptide (TPR) repeat protein